MTQAFNLSQLANNVNTSGLLNAAAGLYNQVPPANGGTGRSSVTSGNLLLGAGTSAMTELTGGTVGNVVTWNGSAWTSATGAGGPAPVVTIYRSPSPWTKPASLKAVRITLLSGGGGGAGVKGGASTATVGGGGGGGAGGIGFFPAASIPGPQTVSVGAGGAGGTAPAAYGGTAPGTTGGTSSFGSFITATGGGGGTNSAGAAGVITSGPQVQGYSGTPAVTSPGGAGDGGYSYQVQGFGGTGVPQPALRINGGPGIGYGAGSSGSYAAGAPLPTVGTVGGSGTQGYVIVEEIY